MQSTFHREVKNGYLRSKPAGTVRTPQDRGNEYDLFESYLTQLHGLEISTGFFDQFDLENRFYWLFRLSELLAKARKMFHEINDQYFEGKLPEPLIRYCNRSTGGYYNSTRNIIGISLPMTVEFGEPEFYETLLHEIAHMRVRDHSARFHALLTLLGGKGHQAPQTVLLQAKRKTYQERNYPVLVECPQCKKQRRYKTRHALHYACRSCCNQLSGGRFDDRFRFQEVKQDL